MRLREPAVLALLLGAVLAVTGAVAAPTWADDRGVVVVRTVEVADPGNPSVGVVPFTDAIYASCADAPTSGPACQAIGAVDHRHGIGQLEVTVEQWVTFLNTVDPSGRNPHRLWTRSQSPTAWPEYGQVARRAEAGDGEHYRVASRAWADKPYGFATFLSAARFVNALDNGEVLRKREAVRGGFHYATYVVRLSPRTERGMYDLRNPATTRTRHRGFVVPSQDEWVKAAYFDPSGGGTLSYWKYPTNPGVFGDGSATAPNPTELGYSTGDVVNAAQVQPVTVTTVELLLHGTDLVDEPELRRGLVALWVAEADTAGLDIDCLRPYGDGECDSPGCWCLADVHAGGDRFVLRASQCADEMVLVRAELTPAHP